METTLARVRIICEKIFVLLLGAVIFLIPWHARWIFSVGEWQGRSWESATTSLYLLEILVVMVAVTGFFVRPKKETPFFGATILVIVSFLSLVWAQNLSVGWQAFRWLAEGVFLSEMVARRDIPWRGVAWAWVASAAVQSVLAFAQMMMQSISSSVFLGIASQDPGTPGVSVVSFDGGRLLRAYGTFPHPNILGGFLAFSVSWALVLARSTYGRFERFLLSAAVIVIAWGLLLTFSRSAMLATAVIFLGWICSAAMTLVHASSRRSVSFLTSVWIVALFGISFLTAAWVFQEPLLQRASGTDFLETYSLSQRADSVLHAKEIFQENPLHGVGIGQEPLKAASKTSPADFPQPSHHVGFLIAAELGIWGILVAAGIGLGMISRFASHFFSSSKEKVFQAPLRFAIFGAVLVLMGLDHYLWTLFSGQLMLWIMLRSSEELVR